jgi:PilZ domain
MENYSASLLSQIPVFRKTSARIALVNLPDAARGLLADCFRQFGVESVLLHGDAAQRLQREKFEACVVRLAPGAETMLEAARTSASNSHMVIYGVGGTIRESLRFSRFGVNAVFNEPLERPAALKLVRATQPLVLHELRRYLRIPVITEVSVQTSHGQRFSATSQEISAGGMSVVAPETPSLAESVEVSFALLTLPRLWIRGNVSWRKASPKTFGVRFDPKDDRRLKIKEWIDGYLEN